MSYRAFKRLLGETSLERKCRFFFGAGILVLIALSFWLYAYQTEHLAYEQAINTCRLLVNPIVTHHHLPMLEAKGKEKIEGLNLQQALKLPEHTVPGQYAILTEQQQLENFEKDLFKDFRKEDTPPEDHQLRSSEQILLYYSPIRASKSCLACHQTLAQERKQTSLAENDLLAIVRIRMPTKNIEEGVHRNRAILMATALGTAIIIMVGSWIIVRYIIVKPVKHLKNVSDAISAGELNVRSEIQTGDEFEDLSHAFNRMLRNLVNMQDQWRKLNADLDRKVDELAQANMALFESNRLKSDFLATVSHELRTPLNSILGFSDVLLAHPNLNEKQQRWVNNIKSSGDKLLALINDILDLAKIEAGKMEIRVDEFSLHDVCEALVAMFRPLAEKKNIDLHHQVDVGVPVMRQDVTKLQQILQNLLSNAVKFTPEGGRVVVKAEADGDYVVITVTDTGLGIAPEEQELVFEKFRQSGNPLTREHAGTGLGLSIVRELTRLLGGEVTLQSELGRGSKFTVRLPLQTAAEVRSTFEPVQSAGAAS